MAFCTKCGSENPEGAVYCTSCAAPMSAPTGVPDQQTYSPVPQVPAKPNFMTTLWRSLDTGSRVAGVGAIVAVIAFFLPLYDGGINGIDLANGAAGGSGDISWWFRLLFALVALGLLYFAYNSDLRKKILIGTAQCAIGAIWGLQVFGVLTGSAFTSQGQQFGWYALHLGLLAILVGGSMSVLDHTRQLAGVRQ